MADGGSFAFLLPGSKPPAVPPWSSAASCRPDDIFINFTFQALLQQPPSATRSAYCASEGARLQRLWGRGIKV